MAKTISNTQYMPDDVIINTTTSNIHSIILCTTASTIISNNINLKTDLPANNNKVIQTTPLTIRVPASYTTNFLSVTRHLQHLSQQIHSSQTNSYTLFRSKGYTSLKKKIKQSLKNYSNICTTKISAQIKSESRTNRLDGKVKHHNGKNNITIYSVLQPHDSLHITLEPIVLENSKHSFNISDTTTNYY